MEEQQEQETEKNVVDDEEIVFRLISSPSGLFC